MATGGSNINAEPDDSMNKLTCGICLEKYRRPKLLPCFHTFCQSCLQGVAGCSPSFACPSCRTLVLLPPGGVGDLQTNFYIEQDVDSATSSPQRRLCDVCTEDMEATHTCMQCQQRLCLPCRQCHDALRMSRGHTVVSLVHEEGCGKEILPSDRTETKQQMEMCHKHPEQRLLFHCNQCGVDMCMQCKLTQHEGHPTDDLADTRAKVKVKVQEMLVSLIQQMKKIDHLIVAVDDRRTKLRQQQQITEQDFKSRADMLCQWVRQSLDEAVASVQSMTHQLEKSLQDQADQLKNKNLALQAKRDHALRVLKDGKEADIVTLETQLSSSPVEDVEVRQMEKELTKKLPALQVKHNTTAVNQLQLRTFVGVLEPVEQAWCPEEAGTDSLQLESVLIERAPSLGTADMLSSASCSAGLRLKQPGRKIICGMSFNAMCPIGRSRLWVLCQNVGHDPILKLFDGNGQVKKTVYDINNSYRLTSAGDILVCWNPGTEDKDVRLITPDGSQSTQNMKMKFDKIISCPAAGNHYLNDYHTGKLYLVKFGYTDNKLMHSDLEVVFDEIPGGNLLGVSADGCYFAFNVFIYDSDFDSEMAEVAVYSKAGTRRHSRLSTYLRGFHQADACFCQIDGQEMLLVTMYSDNNIHIVDHTDGCRFVRYLDTAPLKLIEPYLLATDYYRHVWIECAGGIVVMVDL